MINVQEWLDKNFPKEKRNEITEICLNEPSLEGELDLKDFVHNQGSRIKVRIASNIDRTKLIIKNKPKKVKVVLQSPLDPIWTEWEECGLTYQEAQQWILIGFGTKDYNKVKQWRDNNFVLQGVKAWIDVGLDKWDIEFALYLRWKGYRSSQDLNLEGLKEEFNAWEKENKLAQEYLDIIYSKERRSAIKNLNITFKNLAGSLDLREFVNLELLECHNNQLTSLNLDNCLKLEKINCSNNELTELKVDDLNNLIELWCSSNQLFNLDVGNCNQLRSLRCNDNYLENLKIPFQVKQLIYLNVSSNNFAKQDLSRFRNLTNLETLNLGNWIKEKINQGIYNRFYGSLEPLQNLSKLKYLDISNTDINSGVEYLPDNWSFKKPLKLFHSIAERPESKLKEIAEQLTNFLEYGLCKKCKKVISEFNRCQCCNKDDKDVNQNYWWFHSKIWKFRINSL